MQTKILRTDQELKDYMKITGRTMKFASVEMRSFWNPMRFKYGKFYYKILMPQTNSEEKLVEAMEK